MDQNVSKNAEIVNNNNCNDTKMSHCETTPQSQNMQQHNINKVDTAFAIPEIRYQEFKMRLSKNRSNSNTPLYDIRNSSTERVKYILKQLKRPNKALRNFMEHKICDRVCVMLYTYIQMYEVLSL